MTRQELKTMFFQQDWSKVKERKQIIVNISKVIVTGKHSF